MTLVLSRSDGRGCWRCRGASRRWT